MWKTGLKTAGALVAFGSVHSLLASREAKTWAGQIFGERARNAFYRPFFIFQSFVTLILLWAALRSLPDRTLYRVRGEWAALMRLGQLGGMIYATAAAMQVGLARITGLAGMTAWLRGAAVVPAAPEAQGPAPDPRGGGLKDSGPFRVQRHPLNFAPLPIFWLNPVMNVRLLSYNLMMTVYLILGSIHEERRLRKAYGSEYREYQESAVPFYFPKLSRG